MDVPFYSFLFLFSKKYMLITPRINTIPTETTIERFATTYSTISNKKRNTPIIINHITDFSALISYCFSIYPYPNDLYIY